MSDWQKIKEKCSFSNGELIQVSMVDEYVQQLQSQLSESQERVRVLERQIALQDKIDWEYGCPEDSSVQPLIVIVTKSGETVIASYNDVQHVACVIVNDKAEFISRESIKKWKPYYD